LICSRIPSGNRNGNWSAPRPADNGFLRTPFDLLATYPPLSPSDITVMSFSLDGNDITVI
jgi:hypothetical protein